MSQRPSASAFRAFGGRRPSKYCSGVGRRHHSHFGARINRGAGDVRREDHILARDQRRVDLRLMFVNVECRAGDFLFLERSGKRRFIHHRPARGVDEIRGALHFIERRG